MRSVAQKIPVRVMEISEEPDKKLDLTKVETVDETLKEIPPNTIYGCNLKKLNRIKTLESHTN